MFGRAVGGYCRGIAICFHVSSAANRDSVLAHGLGWTRMGAAPVIAGSAAPEADGEDGYFEGRAA
jgi:hypothetical protein